MHISNKLQITLKIARSIATFIARYGVVKPLIHLLHTALQDRDTLEAVPPGFLDDASHLNQTRITAVWHIPSTSTAPEHSVSMLVQQANIKKLPLSIAGMRHTMGGQTISPGGIILNMLSLHNIELDEQTNILHVQAGACWVDIIPYLHERGRSVAVMQSNNSFSVGGSLSVNCHGWQHNSPPIASTVEALSLLLADGTIIRCSRQEHAELFSLVLGGYGLFGVILDVELRVVANKRYRGEYWVISSERYLERYEEKVNQASDIGLVYGRLNVGAQGSRHFLREAILTVFRTDPHGQLPSLHKPGLTGIRRAIFRGSIGNEYGKTLRWHGEKLFGDVAWRNSFTRNHLLNEGIEVYQNRSRESTDILQEYFLPGHQLEAFLEQLRSIIPAFQGDLLNVTIRNVAPDQDTLLRYADQEVFGLVMLFNQSRTQWAEAQMQAMTQHIIEAALALGGRYYLPYRLHATVEQFYRAYPQAHTFFALKRKYDPHDVFQNELYRKYCLSCW